MLLTIWSCFFKILQNLQIDIWPKFVFQWKISDCRQSLFNTLQHRLLAVRSLESLSIFENHSLAHFEVDLLKCHAAASFRFWTSFGVLRTLPTWRNPIKKSQGVTLLRSKSDAFCPLLPSVTFVCWFEVAIFQAKPSDLFAVVVFKKFWFELDSNWFN